VRYLYDPAGLGLDPELVLDLFDDTAAAGDQLARIRDTLDIQLRERRGTSREVTDVFVYYVGHGYTDDQGQLALLVRRSRRNLEAETGIKAADLARALRLGAPQQRRSVVLDCCFSEAAARAFYGMSSDLTQQVASTAMKDLQDTQPARGTLLLCSSPVGQVSMGPPDAEYTLFTGAVLDVLKKGAEGLPRYLSFADLRDQAFEKMLVSFGANAPRPVLHQANATHGDLTRTPAFRNRAEAATQQTEQEGYRRSAGEEKRDVQKEPLQDTNRRAEKQESLRAEGGIPSEGSKDDVKRESFNWFDVRSWSYQKVAIFALAVELTADGAHFANLWATVGDFRLFSLSRALRAVAISFLVARLAGRRSINTIVAFVSLYLIFTLSFVADQMLESHTSMYVGELLGTIARTLLTWLTVAGYLGYLNAALKDKTMLAIALMVSVVQSPLSLIVRSATSSEEIVSLLLGICWFIPMALMVTYGIRRQQQGAVVPT
jgi:hypothetical protein